MRILAICLFGMLLIACSGSKKASEPTKNKSKNSQVNTPSKKSYNLRDAPPGKIDNSPRTRQMVNKVIEKNTSFDVKDIARSEIIKTRTGYWWKFVNVRTGAKYVVTTDPNFNNVRVTKRAKKKS